MPAKYEAIRDRLEAKGVSAKKAKTSAAKIFNATRKRGEAPVTGRDNNRAATSNESEHPQTTDLGNQF